MAGAKTSKTIHSVIVLKKFWYINLRQKPEKHSTRKIMKSKLLTIVAVSTALLSGCATAKEEAEKEEAFFVSESLLAESIREVDLYFQMDKQDILSLINQNRTNGAFCGSKGYMPPVNPVRQNQDLGGVAAAHLVDLGMNKNLPFGHIGSGGKYDMYGKSGPSRLKDRVAGGAGLLPNQVAGENLAGGFSDEESLVRGWMESDEHCSVLMDARWEEVGISSLKIEGSNLVRYHSTLYRGTN